MSVESPDPDSVRALVTLFNRGEFAPGVLQGLAMVDFHHRTTMTVEVRDPRVRSHFGASGLTRTSDGYALMLQSQPVQLVILDEQLEIADVIDVPTAVHAHSVIELDGIFLIAATGSDAIVGVDRTRHLSEIVWRLPSAGADTIHLNSLFPRGASLGATVFGSRGGNWRESHRGMAVDVMSGEILMAPVFHPHSACDEGGRIVLCESFGRRIVSDGLGQLNIPLGYVRGLDLRPDSMAVGTSRGRRPPFGRCTVQLFERPTERIDACVPASRVDLSDLAPEVYDVLQMD